MVNREILQLLTQYELYTYYVHLVLHNTHIYIFKIHIGGGVIVVGIDGMGRACRVLWLQSRICTTLRASQALSRLSRFRKPKVSKL